MDGVRVGSFFLPFREFTLVLINGTALLYESENATSNLNINIVEEAAYFASACGRLSDAAAEQLQSALNQAATILTGQTHLKPLVTLSLVLAYND